MSSVLARFDTIFAAPTPHNDGYLQVLKLASDYVPAEDVSKLYDWAAFTPAVQSHAGKGITIERSRLGYAILDSQSHVYDVVQKIVAFLGKDMAIPSKYASTVSEKIEAALTDIKTTASKGYAEPKKSDFTHSSWEYRPLLSFPHPFLPAKVCFVVTTIHITADISQESEWLTLGPSSSKKFSVVISAASLSVDKNSTTATTI